MTWISVRTIAPVVMVIGLLTLSCSARDEVDAEPDRGTSAVRVRPAMTQLDERAFVYGGDGGETSTEPPYGDAFLLDPDDGDVERLPAPPGDPLASPSAVSVGATTVMVLGRACGVDSPVRGDGDGMRYVDCRPNTPRAVVLDVASEQWSEVEPPAELERATDLRALGALGSLALLGSDERGELWSYDVADGTWQQLDLPVALDSDEALFAPGIGRFSGCSNHPDEFVLAVWPGQGGTRTTASVSVMSDPAAGWRTAPDVEVAPLGSDLACSPEGSLVNGAAAGFPTWWFDPDTSTLTPSGTSPRPSESVGRIGPMTWVGDRFAGPIWSSNESAEFRPGAGWSTAAAWPALVQPGTNVGLGTRVVYASDGATSLDAEGSTPAGAIVVHHP